jgi:hypothetical protein
MMKRFAFIAACGLWFGANHAVQGLAFVPSSVLLVAMGVALACAASERMHSLSVAAGALGVFGSGALAPSAPAAASALLMGLVFAERSSRIRVPSARLAHIGTSLLGGALAGTLAANFTSASLAVWWVSIVVAVALASLPLLLDADDAMAHELDQAAASLPEPTKAALRGAAELRRHSLEVPLDADARASVERSWGALLGLAAIKAKLVRSHKHAPSAAAKTVDSMVDDKISGHIGALSKAFSAANTMKALATTSDDACLSSVSETSESLDEISRALLEYEVEQKLPTKAEDV